MNCLKSALLVVWLPALWVPIHVTANAQEPAQSESLDVQVNKLQQERLEVLQRTVELALAQYREGDLDFRAVHSMQQDLLAAKLELASSHEERMKLLAAQLKIAKSSLSIAEAMFRAANTSSLDVHQAKAAVLQFEIRMLKLRRLEQSKKP